jgi:hypothetical protein
MQAAGSISACSDFSLNVIAFLFSKPSHHGDGADGEFPLTCLLFPFALVTATFAGKTLSSLIGCGATTGFSFFVIAARAFRSSFTGSEFKTGAGNYIGRGVCGLAFLSCHYAIGPTLDQLKARLGSDPFAIVLYYRRICRREFVLHGGPTADEQPACDNECDGKHEQRGLTVTA